MRHGFFQTAAKSILVAGAISALGIAVTAPAAPPSDSGESSPGGPEILALFSPGGHCLQKIVEQIESARHTIRLQAYLFTSREIGDALIQAKKRDVKVKVILDKSQQKQAFGRWPVLKRQGVDVVFDCEHEIANSKIILIDDKTIITGSYNFTKAAEEKNAENILIIRNAPELFEQFVKNFDSHAAHARKSGA